MSVIDELVISRIPFYDSISKMLSLVAVLPDQKAVIQCDHNAEQLVLVP